MINKCKKETGQDHTQRTALYQAFLNAGRAVLACAWEGFFTDSVLLCLVWPVAFTVCMCVCARAHARARLMINALGLHYSLFVLLMTVIQISYVYRGQISILDS